MTFLARRKLRLVRTALANVETGHGTAHAKLRTLADIYDRQDREAGRVGHTQVQDDLRDIADVIEYILGG